MKFPNFLCAVFVLTRTKKAYYIFITLFAVYPWVASNSLRPPAWPQTCVIPPACGSYVLVLQVPPQPVRRKALYLGVYSCSILRLSFPACVDSTLNRPRQGKPSTQSMPRREWRTWNLLGISNTHAQSHTRTRKGLKVYLSGRAHTSNHNLQDQISPLISTPKCEQSSSGPWKTRLLDSQTSLTKMNILELNKKYSVSCVTVCECACVWV